MITPREHDLLAFIQKYRKEHGISPTHDEMKDGIGCKAKSQICLLLRGLEDKGQITRHKRYSRSIRVIECPEDDTLARIEKAAYHALKGDIAHESALKLIMGLAGA